MSGPTLLPSLLLLLLLVAWGPRRPLVVAQADEPFALHQTDFLARSTVREVRDGSVKLEVSMTELYSSELARGRISLDKQSLFYDATSERLLQHWPKLATCEQLQLGDKLNQVLATQLLDRLLLETGFTRKTDGGPLDVPKHVFGPSKLLFLVAAQMGQLTEQPQDAANTVLGRPCRVFERLTSQARVSVYYELSARNEQLAKTAMPLSVRLSFKDGLRGLIVDFSSVKWGPQVAAGSANSASSFGLEKSLDPLTLPVISGCSALLPRDPMKDMYNKLAIERTQVSFRATGRAGINGPLNSFFVAFDGTSSHIRIDSEPARHGNVSTTVLDLATNRKYLAVREPPMVFQESLAGDSYNPDEVSCLVTHVADPSQSRVELNHYLNLGSFLLGSPAFTFMGLGRVRGTRVRVYESTAASHPAWLDQSVLYKDRTGKYITHWLLFKDSDAQVTVYTTVLYMAELELGSGAKLSRPLQLELYSRDTSAGADASRRLVGYAQIHDFKFALAPAPDGSSVSELFSLPHLCSNMYDRFVELSLELEARPAAKRDPVKDFGWLENGEQRNQALVRMLARSNQLSIPMMYGLSSQLLRAGQHPRFRANFRLAQQPSSLYYLQFLGNGRTKHKADLAGYSLTLDHCLHWIGSSKRTEHVYIILSGGLCELDTLTAAPSHEQPTPTSEAFELDESGASQVYLVSSLPDREMAEKHDWLAQMSAEHLNQIKLTTYAPGEDPTNLNYRDWREFAVTDVQLVGHNYLLGADSSAPASNVISLPNFKLISGQQQVAPVVSKVPGAVMTLDSCQRACLGETSCQSYSFCNAWPDYECLLSSSVRLNRELVAGAPKRAPQHGDRLSSRDGLPEADLVRDPKCNTYNKNYVNQYRRTPQSFVDVSHGNLSQVESMNECARKCYDMNLLELASDVYSADRLAFDPNSPSKSRRQLVESHAENRERFCIGFGFVAAPLTGKVLEVAAPKYLGGPINDSLPLCLTQSPFNSQQSFLSNEFVVAQSYDFAFSKLFDVTGTEALLGDGSPEGRAAKIANSQHAETYKSAEHCSRDCLLQFTHATPACRSFDVLKRPGQQNVQCIFNSKSWADLASELPAANFSYSIDKVHVQHFEPRLGLVADQLEVAAAWAGQGSGWDSLPSRQTGGGAGGLLAGLVSLLLLASGLALGVYLGLQLSQRVPPSLLGLSSMRARTTIDLSLVEQEETGD